MSTQASIAKIARPRFQKVLPRNRLFRMLDKGRTSPVTWVSGPAGSGKTALVASWLDSRKLPALWYQVDEGDADIASFFYYMGLAAKKAAPRYKRPLPLLTPEYVLGIPTFTRRYFEDLCGRLKTHSIIIFDNYQEAPEASAFHEVMVNGLSVLPEGVRAIVISRAEPPPLFTALQAGNKVHTINGNELKLTLEESKGIIELHRVDQATRNLSHWMHEKTQGWAAGLVLLTRAIKAKAVEPEALHDLAPEKVFDYFANELFNRVGASLQDFLLKTAFAPKLTPHLAAELTGNKAAGQILSDLNRRNFFTEKRQQKELTYQYHQLFREFLLARARTELSPETIAEMLGKAAKLLEASGQAEDAAEIYLQSNDRQSLITFILAHAQPLVMQGRSAVLEKWLMAIPADMVDEIPWLLYWKGICRLAVNPVESLKYFKRAFKQFQAQKEIPGVFLAWSVIVDSVVFSFEDLSQLDEWILCYETLAGESGLPKEIASRAANGMFTALAMRQPWRSDLDEWLDRAIATADINIKVQALFYHIFNLGNVGGMAGAARTIELLHRLALSSDASMLSRVMIHLIETIYFNMTGNYESSRTAAVKGLKLAEESGVHLMDFMMMGNGIVSAYNYADNATAAELFTRLPADPLSLRFWERSLYYHLHAVRSFLDGNFNEALTLNEQALKLKAGDLNSPFLSGILHAHIMHELGEQGKAKEFLDRIAEPWRKDGKSHDAFLYYLTKAYLYLDEDENTVALESLGKALSIGKEEHCLATHNPWRPDAIGRLFETALEHDMESEYVRNMIRQRNFVPAVPPMHLEQWPWPVKLYTLGEFRLHLNDKQFAFSGKVQKKPLEMLKALIALGGSEVREDQLMDALWPDADGDAARMSYRSTLHRLRQLIGNEDAVIAQEGRLSLDPRLCWVDAWAFERMLDEALRNAEAPLTHALSPKGRGREKSPRPLGERIEVRGLLEKAIILYRGHFLAGEDKPWATSTRERLKNKFLRAVNLLGDCWMEAGQPKKAMECYEKGLELDDLTEEFYQGLMSCNLKLGRKAEAIKVYKRCNRVLRAGLGVGPSEETEMIYKKVVGK